MSNVGPVCHIPPTNTPANPQPHDMPGLPGPVSPPSPNGGQDLSGLYAAMRAYADMLNRMRQMLLALSNQVGPNNNNGFANNFTTKKGDQSASWVEIAREEEEVKIYQNNDPNTGNYVTVKQINALTMGNKGTGQTWKWRRG